MAESGAALAGSLEAPPHARYRGAPRILGGVVCGAIAGLLSWNVLWTGVSLFFGGEGREWGGFAWRTHWLLRLLASWLATYVSAFIGGVAARERGSLVGVLSNVPAELAWVSFVIYGLSSGLLDPGNGLLSAAVIITTPLLALAAGAQGAEQGRRSGPHYDSRRFSLLGIRWFHYIWIPVVLSALAADATWAFLYSFEDWGMLWRRGVFSPALFYAPLFHGTIWFSIQLIIISAVSAYTLLAGFEPPGKASRTLGLMLIFALGLPGLAVLLQMACVWFYAWVEPPGPELTLLVEHRRWGPSSTGNIVFAVLVAGFFTLSIGGAFISAAGRALGQRKTGPLTRSKPDPAHANRVSIQEPAEPVIGQSLEKDFEFGPYLVKSKLGEGDSAVIFRAIEKQTERPVALKVLSSTDKEAFERFRQGAQALAGLSHPNVVQLYQLNLDPKAP